jgi:ABC-2 type transport system permease protein
MSSTPYRRGQLSAIGFLRWRLFVNTLRTTRGKLELVSRTFISLGFAIGGLGGSIGVAFVAYHFVANGKPEMLALLLWPIFFFWQVFPSAATAFANNPDSSDLLRFPLTYHSYFLIRVAYGLFDPAAALGSLWLTGMLVGIGIAQPVLLPWATLIVFTFALFNLLLTLMIFSWIERWLAQRRTREIFAVLFILTTLSFQLIGPMMHRLGGSRHPDAEKLLIALAPVQRMLPPGMAADAIAEVLHAALFRSLESFALLTICAVVVAGLLHLRLRAQFRGENLSEVPAQKQRKNRDRAYASWKLSALSPPVAAVLEKEIRYLLRSGPMLLTLIMPIFVLVVFRLGPLSAMHYSGGFTSNTPSMAFPAAAAYALLSITNLVFNTFGADGGGIQFFYASPVRFREIILAKNMTQGSILVFNTALAWIAVAYLYAAPALDITAATLIGLLFAAPLNFAIGNMLSIYAPKKRDFATFGRQNASQITVFASLGLQAVTVGIGAGAFLLAGFYGSYWIAAAIFFVLAAVSISGYIMSLRHIDQFALNHRETLMAELCRT